MKKFLTIRPQENFSFFLMVSLSFHLFLFAILIEQSVMKQSTHPFAIEVELIGMNEGGGGGGGGEDGDKIKGKSEVLKNKMKEVIHNPVIVENKEDIVPSPQRVEEEKNVASLSEPASIGESLESSMKGRNTDAGVGGGTGGGTGSGVGSGTGSGTGSGVGSGIGSGIGSGAGAGHGAGGSGVRDELHEFQRKIKERIERVKAYPLLARRNQYEGTASCAFTLLRDGNVKGIRLLERSGYPILDEAAKKAIREAAPYPPFPSCIEGSSIDVKVPLVYKLKDLES